MNKKFLSREQIKNLLGEESFCLLQEWEKDHGVELGHKENQESLVMRQHPPKTYANTNEN